MGTKEIPSWSGGHFHKVDRYEPYWENFCKHVDDIALSTPWDLSKNSSPQDIVMDAELAKYGGTFKRTKVFKGNYLKFKSHKHLTMFILKWS